MIEKVCLGVMTVTTIRGHLDTADSMCRPFESGDFGTDLQKIWEDLQGSAIEAQCGPDPSGAAQEPRVRAEGSIAEGVELPRDSIAFGGLLFMTQLHECLATQLPNNGMPCCDSLPSLQSRQDCARSYDDLSAESGKFVAAPARGNAVPKPADPPFGLIPYCATRIV